MAFSSGDVLYLRGGKFGEEVMEVLRNLAILTSHQTEEVSKAVEVVFERTHLVLAGVEVLGVDFVGFISVQFDQLSSGWTGTRFAPRSVT